MRGHAKVYLQQIKNFLPPTGEVIIDHVPSLGRAVMAANWSTWQRQASTFYQAENWMCSSKDCRERNCTPFVVISAQNIVGKCSLCANLTRFRRVFGRQTGWVFLPCLYLLHRRVLNLQNLLKWFGLVWFGLVSQSTVSRSFQHLYQQPNQPHRPWPLQKLR